MIDNHFTEFFFKISKVNWAFSEVGETIDYRFAGLFIKKTNTKWAASSVVEREVDVFEAIGSIPMPPTLYSKQ